MTLTDFNDLDDASLALCRWLESQNLVPHEGMILISYMAARMILQNSNTPADIDRKLHLHAQTIRAFISAIRDCQ